ncbi:hypothetical protein BH10ACT1_BH10ACT1_08020 [soil metagenome]
MNRVDLYRSAKGPVAPFIRRHWQNPVFKGLAGLSARYLRIYGNNNHYPFTNGEGAYLDRLPKGSVLQAFDVGGFRGEWTDLLHRAHPDSEVHCFEVTPATAAALQADIGADPRITVNPFGLSTEDGELSLFVNAASPNLNSLVHDRRASVSEVTVPVRRGDSYLSEHGIEHIDVLKIDTEGYDINVLRGFNSALTAGAISVIQFEYCDWNITSRVLLLDFYALLEPLGYAIGKVHPDTVAFKDYENADEDWTGPACIAVHESRPDLLAALRG